jgi:hypothetical protein
MAFLALLQMSLYEPEETSGDNACKLHPIKKRPWVDNQYVRYAADMNVALAYYNCLDDWEDDHKLSAKAVAGLFRKYMPQLQAEYPRQCQAMETCIAQLSRLEGENCQNPDEPANQFGQLMAELLVWKEDLWAKDLRPLGMALGRFIYLADAVQDWEEDCKNKKYNPLSGSDPTRWDEYLLLAMARCTHHYERLPLVQDKHLLDNVLYSGIWVEYRRKQGRKRPSPEESNDGRSV